MSLTPQANTLAFYRRFKRMTSKDRSQSKENQRPTLEDSQIEIKNFKVQPLYTPQCLMLQNSTKSSSLAIPLSNINISSNNGSDMHSYIKKSLKAPNILTQQPSVYQSLHGDNSQFILQEQSRVSDHLSTLSQQRLTEDKRVRNTTQNSSYKKKKKKQSRHMKNKMTSPLVVKKSKHACDNMTMTDFEQRLHSSTKKSSKKRRANSKTEMIKILNEQSLDSDYKIKKSLNDSINQYRSLSHSKTRTPTKTIHSNTYDARVGTETSLTPNQNPHKASLVQSTLKKMKQIEDNLSEEDKNQNLHEQSRHQGYLSNTTMQSNMFMMPCSPLTINKNFMKTIGLNQTAQSNISSQRMDPQQLMLSQEAILAIQKKMRMVAKELSENEDLGLDENTLLKLFESKTDQFLNLSQASQVQQYQHQYDNNPAQYMSNHDLVSSNRSALTQKVISQKPSINHHPHETYASDKPEDNKYGSPFLQDRDQSLILQNSQLHNQSYAQDFHQNQQQSTVSKDLRETFAQKDLNLQSYRYDNQFVEENQPFQMNGYGCIKNVDQFGGNSTVIMDNTNNDTILNQNFMNLQEGDISYLNNLEDSEALFKSNKVSTGKKRQRSSKRNSSQKNIASRKLTSVKKKSNERSNSQQSRSTNHMKSPQRIRLEQVQQEYQDQIQDNPQFRNQVLQNSMNKQYISLTDNFGGNFAHIVHPVRDLDQSDIFCQSTSQGNLAKSFQDHKSAQHLSTQSQQNFRQYSVTPAFAESMTQAYHTQQQRQQQRPRTPSQLSQTQQSQKVKSQRVKTPQSYKSYKDTMVSSKGTKTLTSKQQSLSLANTNRSSSNNNTKPKESKPHCKCASQMRITKEAIKKGMKLKYEQRLKELKVEFTNKFKTNEQTWKKRLDYHKTLISKEAQRAEEYLKTISEMTKRIEMVEKKNQDLFKLIQQQKAYEKQLALSQNVLSYEQSQQPIKQVRIQSKSQKRIPTTTMSSDDSFVQQENMADIVNMIKEDEHKLKRIEKILYRK